MTLVSSEASPALRRQVLLECLREFAQVRLTVSGACMEPALKDGDVVTLVAASRRPPRLGDVVLALVGDGVQLHRLVWTAGGRRRTKADRAPTWDAALREPDLIATAVEVQSGPLTRTPRSAARMLRSLLAVAAAHLRALRPRSLRG
jgi:hypothetical protein